LVDVNTTTGVNKTKLGNNMVVTCGEPFGRNFICQDQAKLYPDAAPTAFQCMLWGMADGYQFTSWSESDNVLGKNLCVACRSAQVAVRFDGWNMYCNNSCHRGAIKLSTGDQDQYLTCSETSCTFEDGPPTQEFVENPAYINPPPEGISQDESRFLIYDISGPEPLFLGNCLDRRDWDKPTSITRAASCGSTGAVRWAYNATTHQLTEDENNNCLQVDGNVAHCHDGSALVQFVDPKPTCSATEVKGGWVYRFTVTGATSETLYHGTEKAHSESKTEQWGHSVSATTAVAWIFEFDGNPVIGGGVISGTAAWETSKRYSDEWSTSETHSFTVSFPKSKEYQGKAVWQFQFAITDSCRHIETSLTREYALTQTREQQPCCIPGFTADAPWYTTCLSAESMIKNGTALGCKVNATQHV